MLFLIPFLSGHLRGERGKQMEEKQNEGGDLEKKESVGSCKYNLRSYLSQVVVSHS